MTAHAECHPHNIDKIEKTANKTYLVNTFFMDIHA